MTQKQLKEFLKRAWKELTEQEVKFALKTESRVFTKGSIVTITDGRREMVFNWGFNNPDTLKPITKIKGLSTATRKGKERYKQTISKEDGWTPLESIEEFLITALEGGSNYWYWLDENDIYTAEKWLDESGVRNAYIHYKWLDAVFQNHDLTIRVYDCEEFTSNDDEDEQIGSLNMKRLLQNLLIAKRDYEEDYCQHFPEYNGGDANSADTLFQIAVLGEVIYG